MAQSRLINFRYLFFAEGKKMYLSTMYFSRITAIASDFAKPAWRKLTRILVATLSSMRWDRGRCVLVPSYTVASKIRICCAFVQEMYRQFCAQRRTPLRLFKRIQLLCGTKTFSIKTRSIMIWSLIITNEKICLKI